MKSVDESVNSSLSSEWQTPEEYNALQQEFDESFINSIEIHLKPKYEEFACGLSKGLSATEALIAATPGCKATRKTMSERASRLLKDKPEIRQRAVQLRMQASVSQIASLEEALKIKTEIARNKKNKAADRNKATQDLIDFHLDKKGRRVNVDIRGSVANTLSKDAISSIAELIATAKQG